MSRFVERPKHVNPNIAMDLINEIPPKACKERVVSCDGGSGPTGHPKVYINLVSVIQNAEIRWKYKLIVSPARKSFFYTIFFISVPSVLLLVK